MNLNYRILILPLALSALFVTQTLQAGPREEIAQLRQEIEQMKQTSLNNNGQVAATLASLNEIKTEIQAIKGQMESAGWNRVEKDNTYLELEKRIQALESKLTQLQTVFQDYKKVAPAATSPATPGDKPAQPNQNQTKSTNSEKADYAAVLKLLATENYSEAASGLLGFLEKYPQSSFKSEAQFWLAESYFSMKDYLKAINEYQKYIETAPQGNKIRIATFHQGVSFLNLKSYPEAELFFQKVMQTFPNTPEASQAANQLMRIGRIKDNESSRNPESQQAPAEQS